MKNLSLFFVMVFLSTSVLFSCINKVPVCENCEFTCLEDGEADVIDNNCFDDYDCTFKIFSESEVDIEVADGLTTGEKTVFRMINSTEGEPDIADDEFTQIFIFDLDDKQESFSVENEDLELLNIYYKRICFCPNVDFYKITEGCMQGEQQSDGSWFVQASLILPTELGGSELKFELQFTQ